MENNKLLDIQDLIVEYSSDGEIVHAVNKVCLSLNRGETIGLVGETGAGKTTIAKAILRILPDRSAKVPSGSIIFDGKDLLSIPEDEMRKVRGARIAMVFQDPMTALNPVKKVGKQISGVIALHNDISESESDERAAQMMELVGITRDRFNEYPHQFSGGMKQRIVIAMALACNPDLLLADEPTTALDVTIQAQVLEMMLELKTKKNTSMIMITHDLGIVAETCEKVGVIYAGEIIEFGTKQEIFKSPSHPYTVGLFGALPDLESEDEWLHPINGLPPDPTNLPEGCKFQARCPYVMDICKNGEVPIYSMGGEHTCKCHLKSTNKEGGKE